MTLHRDEMTPGGRVPGGLLVKGAMARLVAVAVSVAALAALSACRHRPKAGGECHIPNQLACDGTAAALVCDSAVWVNVPCRGQRGCSRTDDSDECDDTIASHGDACPRNPPLDYACTADRHRALVCKGGRFGLWRECRGPDQCDIVDGHNLHCDTTMGEPGDPCGQRGAYSCSVDRQTMLACDGSVLAAAASCRGPQGCSVQREARKVDCDDSIALDGDPCDQPKRIACSVDGKAELVCAAGKYTKKRDCRRSDCKLEGNELFCD